MFFFSAAQKVSQLPTVHLVRRDVAKMLKKSLKNETSFVHCEAPACHAPSNARHKHSARQSATCVYADIVDRHPRSSLKCQHGDPLRLVYLNNFRLVEQRTEP